MSGPGSSPSSPPAAAAATGVRTAPRRRAALLVALAALACDEVPAPPPCPGELQGRVTLRATIATGGDCAAAAGATQPPQVPAAIAFAGTDAALCPERELAAALTGPRQGDSFDVAAAPSAANVPGCTCAVRVEERVTGSVVRDATGAVTGFSGTLQDAFTAADGSPSCAANAGATCPIPCSATWTLAAP